MATWWSITIKWLSLALHDLFSVHLELSINVSHLSKQLFDLPEGINFINVFRFALKELVSLLLHQVLLFGGVCIIHNTTLISKSIVHGQFLLKLLNFPFHLLAKKSGILLHVDNCFVGYLHHTRSELKSRYSLLILIRLWVNISNHNCLTVASNRVLEEVC